MGPQEGDGKPKNKKDKEGGEKVTKHTVIGAITKLSGDLTAIREHTFK